MSSHPSFGPTVDMYTSTALELLEKLFKPVTMTIELGDVTRIQPVLRASMHAHAEYCEALILNPVPILSEQDYKEAISTIERGLGLKQASWWIDETSQCLKWYQERLQSTLRWLQQGQQEKAEQKAQED
jgi:hypothetical protein